MSEIVRSVIAYFSQAVGSRRCAERRSARLPLSISLADCGGHQSQNPQVVTCEGLTHDISATGLSFTLPTMRIGNRHLFGETLHVRFELPGGRITLRAAPTRYDLLEGEGFSDAYLVGARIIEMDAESRARLKEYLRATRRLPVEGSSRDRAQERESAYGV